MQQLREQLIRAKPGEEASQFWYRHEDMYELEKTKILFEYLAVRALKAEFDQQNLNLVKDGYLSWMSVDDKFSIFFNRKFDHKFKKTNPKEYGFKMSRFKEKMGWKRHLNAVFKDCVITLKYIDEEDLYMYTETHPHWFYTIQYADSLIYKWS